MRSLVLILALAAPSQMFDPSANADDKGVREMPMEGALEAIESASSYQFVSLVYPACFG